jgi:hypothetical protein
MSRIAPLIAEPVAVPKRRTLTPARKLRCHTFHGGLCGECGGEVPLFGRGVVYDHKTPLQMGGSDDDGPNLRPIHKACDRFKTPADQRRIAKAQRTERKNNGTWTGSGRSLKSRGFQRSLRRRMNGHVEAKP